MSSAIKIVKCLQDDFESSKELDMYLQFNFVLRDVSAFLVDGDYHWSQIAANKSAPAHLNYAILLPVIDNCGVTLKVEQV